MGKEGVGGARERSHANKAAACFVDSCVESLAKRWKDRPHNERTCSVQKWDILWRTWNIPAVGSAAHECEETRAFVKDTRQCASFFVTFQGFSYGANHIVNPDVWDYLVDRSQQSTQRTPVWSANGSLVKSHIVSL